MSGIDDKLAELQTALQNAMSHMEIAAADTQVLVAKAETLVEMLDEREKYHGSLIGPETLMLVNDLRLELARWKK